MLDTEGATWDRAGPFKEQDQGGGLQSQDLKEKLFGGTTEMQTCALDWQAPTWGSYWSLINPSICSSAACFVKCLHDSHYKLGTPGLFWNKTLLSISHLPQRVTNPTDGWLHWKYL